MSCSPGISDDRLIVQHVFDADAVSPGRVVQKDVRDGADEFSVLHDGAARHTLHDAARAADEFAVRDLEHKILVFLVVFVHFDDGTEDELQYSEWIETSIGDGYLLTRNRLGMTYKSVPLEAD